MSEYHPTTDPQNEAWQSYLHSARAADSWPSFESQWQRFNEVFSGRDPALGPPGAWLPGEDQLRHSNLARFITRCGIGSFTELYRWSVADRGAFWGAVIEELGISFATPSDRVLANPHDPRSPGWLQGARLNIVDSCFLAPPTAAAVIHASEDEPELCHTTYAELETLVNRVANGLLEQGFTPGEGIALFMPMTMECVAAYLGVIRAGCHVVSIADSFSAPEVTRRLQISGARGMITVDAFTRGGKLINLFERAVEAGAPRAVVLPRDRATTLTLRPDDLVWHELLSEHTAPPRHTAGPDQLINVLFSSGTTGDPKAIPWTQLTPIKCAMDGRFHQDIRSGDVVAWPTNIGWMMGPWLIFASLVNRAAVALFEGSPGTRAFTRFVEASGVTMLGVVPSLVRSWRGTGAADESDWGQVRVFSSTGEPSNREDYLWLMSRARYEAPVIEYCGGTEIGGGHLSGSVLQPACPATFSTPTLGHRPVILDDSGRFVGEGEEGELYLVPPSIGLSEELLNANHEQVYHAGCPQGPDGELLRRHGDQVRRLGAGYLQAQGRADDTMNLGGIKVSSQELETVVDGHLAVYESAAIAVQPGGEGAEQLVLFVVLQSQIAADTLHEELQARIAAELNPLFRISDLVAVERLPRTASNKLMRRTLRARYLAHAPQIPPARS